MINRRGFLLGSAGSVVAAVTAPPIIHELITELAPADNYVARYTHKTYSMAYVDTKVIITDTELKEIGMQYSRMLAQSMMQTRRVIEYDMLNEIFGGNSQPNYDDVSRSDL
jgi:hypothetical protein